MEAGGRAAAAAEAARSAPCASAHCAASRLPSAALLVSWTHNWRQTYERLWGSGGSGKLCPEAGTMRLQLSFDQHPISASIIGFFHLQQQTQLGLTGPNPPTRFLQEQQHRTDSSMPGPSGSFCEDPRGSAASAASDRLKVSGSGRCYRTEPDRLREQRRTQPRSSWRRALVFGHQLRPEGWWCDPGAEPQCRHGHGSV